jgi:hypothetical protein
MPPGPIPDAADLTMVWHTRSTELFLSDVLPATAVVVAFALVGALVAGRQPRNAIGWILCTIGLSTGLVSFTDEYARYALWTAPGSLWLE